MVPWIVWAVIGVILIIAEMMTFTFYLLWLGIGALAAGVLALFIPDAVFVQVLAGAVVAIILTIFTKPLTRKVRHSKGFKDAIDVIVGRQGEVIQKIEVGTLGIVKVGGEIWSASASETIEPGTTVIVVSKGSAVIEVTRMGGV
ncbi:NfeD family protein [Paenibacillus sp. N1-5-1-14]|uniref:NfeD family protein n=1 Tax=Paenibacillus radicibacter TaxID=2972488 RepID=UPI0021596B4E|nr:NfeD family protein [Paenibacillus radicibacter]MCR8643157.1 NfeD family protein [Paenibacillus radicibacter]